MVLCGLECEKRSETYKKSCGEADHIRGASVESSRRRDM